MNITTVYKALMKQAAGMPETPVGGLFKQKPALPPAITTPDIAALQQAQEMQQAPVEEAVPPEDSKEKTNQELLAAFKQTARTIEQSRQPEVKVASRLATVTAAMLKNHLA